MKKNRRAFLQLLGVTGFTAVAMTEGQESHGQPPKREKCEFVGISKKGDVEEALKKAIHAAQGSVRHPDAMVDWSLKRVTGRAGGIAGFDEVTVAIEAVVS
jgi:hypothetical protein